MGKTKIVIGVIVVAIVVGAGYWFLESRNNGNNAIQSGSNNTGGVIMETGNPYDQQHLQRTLNSGGTPGDGGGG